MVFDNASDDHGVSKYIPQGNRGNLLFTSRNPTLARFVPVEDLIEVGDIEEEDAISLLLRSSRISEGTTQTRQAARLIVKELCCLPLAVDQAGAAISSGLCSIDDYLQRYHQHRQELLANPDFKGASSYGRAVYGTWDLSFTMIRGMGTRGESAVFILRTCAFIHHQNISVDIIRRAAKASKELTEIFSRNGSLPPQLLRLDQEGNWDSFFFQTGIQILLSFSLIKRATSSGIYSIHPLVHCWSRDSMSP